MTDEEALLDAVERLQAGADAAYELANALEISKGLGLGQLAAAKAQLAMARDNIHTAFVAKTTVEAARVALDRWTAENGAPAA